MKLYEKILKEMKLLKEDVSINDINDSITSMRPAIINYINNEGEKQAQGERKIYPIAYGISTAGNPVIRAFEKEGDTATKVPAWKLFIVPNIISWKTIDNETFKDEELIGINKNGKDKQIQTLYNVSPLSDIAKQWINNEPVIKSTPIEKTDVNNSGKYSANDIVNNTINYAIKQKNVDNVKNNEYNSSGKEIKQMTAKPETEPIVKSDINNIPQQNIKNNQENNDYLYSDNKPVEKDDILHKNSEEEENNITDTYNNLLDRWNTPPEE